MVGEGTEKEGHWRDGEFPVRGTLRMIFLPSPAEFKGRRGEVPQRDYDLLFCKILQGEDMEGGGWGVTNNAERKND